MLIEKHEIMEAIKILGESSPVGVALAELAEGSEKEHLDLCDLEQYFSYQLWSDEDIESVLKEKGFDSTSENIQAVLKQLDLEIFADCEAQNCQLQEAVDQAAKAGLLKAAPIPELKEILSKTCDFLDIWKKKDENGRPVSEMGYIRAVWKN